MLAAGATAAFALPAAARVPSTGETAAPKSITSSSATGLPANCEPESVGSEQLVTFDNLSESASMDDPTAVRAGRIQSSTMSGYSFQPPPGFDPLTAPNNLMTMYGFPTRPTDPKAAALWAGQMQKVKQYLDSDPPLQGLCSMPSHGSNVVPAPVQPTQARAGSTSSQAPFASRNWGGMWNNGGGPSAYYSISGTYKQPTFVNNCTSTSGHSTWVGLGGYNGRPLMQVGTDFVVNHLNNDYAFWETVGGPGTVPEQVISGFSVQGGQGYTPEVSYNGSNHVATFRITDTNGHTQGYALQGWTINGEFYPASFWYYGDPAEAVEERTYYGFLPQFTKTTGATDWGNIQVNGQTSKNFPWQEIDMWEPNSQGDLLDYPAFPSGSTFQMNNRWWNCI